MSTEPENLPVSAQELSLADSERRLKLLEARRALVLKTLNVTDVARLGDQLAKNKYAAEKLHEIFGGAFELLKDNAGKPFLEVQTITDDPDVGTYRIYTVFGRYERPDGKVVEEMGSFSTKDEFFAKAHGDWKQIHEISLVDVMTAAQTEAYKKCIFRGCGLGNWTVEESQVLASSAKGHDFGARPGGARDTEITIKWGSGKDKKIGQLTDKELSFYVDAAHKDLTNPEKEKYKKHTEKLLAALNAEQERRKAPTASSAAAADAPPAALLTRGQRQSAIFKRLSAFKEVRGSAILQVLTGKESLTELSEGELALLEGTSAEDLTVAVAQMAAERDSV